MRPLFFRRAFTLIELLVTLAIISLLAALLFPVLAQSREKARQNVCLSSLHQIGGALALYLSDYDEAFPPFCTGVGRGRSSFRYAARTLLGGTSRPYPRGGADSACPNVDIHRLPPTDNPGCVNGYAFNVALGDFKRLGPNAWIQTGRPFAVVRYPSLTYGVTEARAGYIALAGNDNAHYFLGGMHLKGYGVVANRGVVRGRAAFRQIELLVSGLSCETHDVNEFWIKADSDGSTLSVVP